MMGGYLLAILLVDYSKDNYCQNKLLWLQSTGCLALGVVSTIASQLALFDMTALSIFRMNTVKSRSLAKEPADSFSSRLALVVTFLVIVLPSIAIACFPAIQAFEDFFVNGLYYHQNPLFTASVTKETHYSIFKAHYGRLKDGELPWTTIRLLVSEMFTSDYGGKW